MSHSKSYKKAEKAFGSGDYAEALLLYRQIVSADPEEADAVWGVAECFHSLGEHSLAIQWYRKYLELEPDEPEATHMLAALGEGKAPRRAGDEYVVAHFDRFADDFDKQLLEELDYSAPRHLGTVLSELVGEASGDLAILDAGCGTGLCGPFLKPFASRLDGVDLSGEMLKKAEERALYDDLYEDELGRFMRKSDRTYDIVLAADTVCYFGALGALLKATARILEPGGYFLFSVEADDEISTYRLTESGRYVHATGYIEKSAADAGLETISVTRETLRTEYGEAVEGDIWVLRAAG